MLTLLSEIFIEMFAFEFVAPVTMSAIRPAQPVIWDRVCGTDVIQCRCRSACENKPRGRFDSRLVLRHRGRFDETADIAEESQLSLIVQRLHLRHRRMNAERPAMCVLSMIECKPSVWQAECTVSRRVDTASRGLVIARSPAVKGVSILKESLPPNRNKQTIALYPVVSPDWATAQLVAERLNSVESSDVLVKAAHPPAVFSMRAASNRIGIELVSTFHDSALQEWRVHADRQAVGVVARLAVQAYSEMAANGDVAIAIRALSTR